MDAYQYFHYYFSHKKQTFLEAQQGVGDGGMIQILGSIIWFHIINQNRLLTDLFYLTNPSSHSKSITSIDICTKVDI